MRTIVAIATSLSMLLAGVWAISEQAQRFNPTNDTSASTNATYDLGADLFDGLFSVGGKGMIWLGVAAIVLVSMGLLVAASSGGR